MADRRTPQTEGAGHMDTLHRQLEEMMQLQDWKTVKL